MVSNVSVTGYPDRIIDSLHRNQHTCVTNTGLEPSPLKTPLESPQLEKIVYFSEIKTQIAVVPLLSSPLATSGIFL